MTERPALPAEELLKRGFLRWQCRMRQIMMREERGRPGPGVVASVTLEGEAEPLGHIITVLSKSKRHSKTPESFEPDWRRSTADPTPA